MGEMRVMVGVLGLSEIQAMLPPSLKAEGGDTKIIWDKDKPDEVEAAKAVFDKLKAKKYQAFSVKEEGKKGKQIFDFDPSSEKIIMAGPVQGG